MGRRRGETCSFDLGHVSKKDLWGGWGGTNKKQQKQKVAIWNTRTAAHVLGIPDQLEASEKVVTDFRFCCCYFCLSKSWSGFHPERETLTGAGVLQASGGVRTARQQDKPSKGSLLKQTSSTTHIPWIKSPERKWSAALWRLLDQTSCLSGESSRKINRANKNNFAFNTTTTTLLTTVAQVHQAAH